MVSFLLAAAAAAAALFEHYGPASLVAVLTHNITLQQDSELLGLYEVRLAGAAAGAQLLSCSVAGRYRVFASHGAPADCSALEEQATRARGQADWLSVLSRHGWDLAVVFDGEQQTFELLSSGSGDEPFSIGLSRATGSLVISDGRLPNSIDAYLASTAAVCAGGAAATGGASSVLLDARFVAPFIGGSSSSSSVCRGFRRAAEGALLLSSGLQRSHKSLLHWRSRCALSTPVVHMYEASYAPQLMHSALANHSADPLLYPGIADHTRCSVYRVDGELANRSSTYRIHCLDDLFGSGPVLRVVGAMGLSAAYGPDGSGLALDFASLERVPAVDEFLDLWAALAAQQRQAAAAWRAGRRPQQLRVTSPLTAFDDAGSSDSSGDSSGDSSAPPQPLLERKKVHPLAAAEFSLGSEGVNVCHGISFILIFVLREQLPAAKEVAQAWRTGCLYRDTCMMYNRIFVFEALPPPGPPPPPGSCADLLQLQPALRSSLLTAREIADSYASGKDVVTVLVGLPMVLSFPQIATHTRLEQVAGGLVPAVPMGEYAYYRLRSLVLVAAARGGGGDPRGLAAHGSSLVHMLDSVFERDAEWQQDGEDDDERLGSVLQLYFGANAGIVAVDSNHTTFDASLALGAFEGAAAAADGRCRLQRFAAQPPPLQHPSLGINEHVVEIVQSLFPQLPPADAQWQTAPPAFKEADMKAMLGPGGALHAFAMDRSVGTVFTDASWSTLGRVLEHALRACFSALRAPASLPQGVSQLYVQLADQAVTLVGHAALHLRLVTSMVLLREYDAVAGMLQALLAHALDWRASRRIAGAAAGEVEELEDRLVESMHNSLSMFLSHAGPFEHAVSALTRSLAVASYAQVHLRRAQWHEQRKAVGAARLRVLTAASNETRELGLLRRSAQLAGVDLTVVGLGRTYTTFYDKLVWYCEYLRGDSGVEDHEVLMLVDAYDVLLFPGVALAPLLLARSTSPVLACAEYGIHPDLHGASFYRRGADSHRRQHSSERFFQLFLNSGCVVGRAGQLKDLMLYALRAARLNQDDQLVFTHYLFENPDLVDIDVDNALFVTGYALQKATDVQLLVESTLDLTLVAQASLSALAPHIGVLHCNNMKSNMLYENVRPLPLYPIPDPSPNPNHTLLCDVCY